MGSMELLKIGDLVSCHYGYHVGIGYGRVLKIVDRKTKQEHQEYGPIITGRGDENSRLDITIQFVGYDLRYGDMETDLGEIVEIDDIQVLDPHDVYRVVNEETIAKIRSEWERLLNSKLEFFYKHVNKPSLEGRKSLPGMKF
jgi:hypothetical protein